MAERTSRHVAVVAGGVAGLAVAVDLLDRARAAGLDLRVTVLEKGANPGGNLQTLREDGWQLEWGPNGFLDSEPATLRLAARAGVDGELLPSSDATRHRFLLVDGRLQEIPTAPGAFLKSRMMPLGAKLRMAGELFVPARRDLGRAAEDPSTDETVDAFGRRRLGPEFAEVMLDPMVKGVFGGNSRKLSLAAAFPRMVELEKNHGGLFKAMIALGRQKRKQGKSSTDAGPSGRLTSFNGGMGQLVDGLARALDADPRAELVTGAAVTRVTFAGGAWHVAGPDFDRGPFDAVVDAAPGHAAAVQLRELLGVLWTSSIFPRRAPEGKVLLRCMAGGADNPGVLELDDEALLSLTLAELRPLLGIKGVPEMVRIIRHRRAIAQYVPGHLARLAALDRELENFPGLFLTGSSYKGISVNSCAKEAESVADRVVAHLAAQADDTSLEAV